MLEALRLFETPILVLDLPQMDGVNAALLRWLPGRRARDPGIRRANGGGWHSTPDLAISREPICQELMQILVGASQEALRVHYGRDGQSVPPFGASVQGWLMALGANDYVLPHDHAGAHWSAAYYVDPGDGPTDGQSGCIAFVHPVSGVPQIPGLAPEPTEVSIRPRAGMLVLFPAWLKHYVHPYRGARERVVVSFNLTLSARGRPPPR